MQRNGGHFVNFKCTLLQVWVAAVSYSLSTKQLDYELEISIVDEGTARVNYRA